MECLILLKHCFTTAAGRPATADGHWPASHARGLCPQVPRRSPPTHSPNGAPRPWTPKVVPPPPTLGPKVPPPPTTLGGEGPKWGGRDGPTFRPRVQGGVGGWDLEGPTLGGYPPGGTLQGGTVHFDLAFTTRAKSAVGKLDP